MKIKSDGLLYVLATKRFFSDGPCGRVSHAVGFASGVADQKIDVTMLAGEGAKNFLKNQPKVNLVECKSDSNIIWWIKFIYKLYYLSRFKSLVVIRWRPIIAFLVLPILLFNRNIWLEVNSLTGIDSPRWYVRLGVIVSIFLIAKCFNVIVVSDASHKQIENYFNIRKNIVVMPNGFFPEGLNSFVPIIDPSQLPSIVYFGRRQDYYDWILLYKVCQLLIDKQVISGLHIFGFDENNYFPWVNYYGEFDKDALLQGLANVVNPILVIHPSNSEIAKSGSPMKLFEYAALSLPVVVGSALCLQSKKFSEFNFFESGNELSLRNTIVHVCENYSERLSNAITSRRTAIDNYSWPAVTKEWVSKFFL